ncbi:DUF1351 domain-containing protein [Marinilactibacillus psychrotolerans]|uniref:DUF1351 domain-containing protein n=1 Tax=Marinilactibacillus psychrotolerans TaxID=191770 RepID=A0A5R9C439_9LACT|nr:DUF1351 domain-containing protein [Marinilactibacillus psychrotolerans]TLQ07594.1 DUF1351 domain-containing protein [Marinilactibacillus psychrotolerans]
MTNELIENSSFGLKYTPAVLEMERYEEMEEAVKAFADKYSGLVFTAAEKNGATEARSELIALQNSLEAERKNVKKEYNKPLQEFETKVKKLVDMIGEPLDDIRDGLKVIEEGERERRESALQSTLESMIKNNDRVSIDDLEQPSSWLNKGNFTNKLKPTAKFEKELFQAIKEKEREFEHKEAQKRIVTNYCETKEIDPSGWLQQLNYRSATEIMDSINQEENRKKEKARLAQEREEREKEAAQALAKEVEQIQRVEKTEIETQAETDIEPTSQIELVKEVYTDTIEITGTAQQLKELNEYLKSSGIKVKKVEDSFVLDGLPF